MHCFLLLFLELIEAEHFDRAVEQVLDALGPDFENSGVPESFVKQVVF